MIKHFAVLMSKNDPPTTLPINKKIYYSKCLVLEVLGDKQHQISCGDNYNKFYLLLLFDHRGLGFGGLSLRVLGVIGGFYVHTLV